MYESKSSHVKSTTVYGVEKLLCTDECVFLRENTALFITTILYMSCTVYTSKREGLIFPETRSVHTQTHTHTHTHEISKSHLGTYTHRDVYTVCCASEPNDDGYDRDRVVFVTDDESVEIP